MCYCIVCSRAVCRWLLFLFNIILLILAVMIILVALGYARTSSKLSHDQLVPNTMGAAILGCILVVIAILGLLGAACDWKLLLFIYAIIMFILIFAILILLILAIVHGRNTFNFTKFFNKGLKQKFDNYSKDKDAKGTVDFIQQDFQCCGVDDPKYWKGKIPTSCCKKGKHKKKDDKQKSSEDKDEDNEKGEGNDQDEDKDKEEGKYKDDKDKDKDKDDKGGGKDCTEDKAFKTGCSKALASYSKNKLKTIACICAVLALIALLAANSACFVARARRRCCRCKAEKKEPISPCDNPKCPVEA